MKKEFEIKNNVLKKYNEQEGKIEVVIPAGVVVIGDNAFKKCEKIKKVILPGGVRKIGKNAFEGCINLENINFPYGVKKIDNYAFDKCPSLTSITIPNSVNNIGAFAFEPDIKEINISSYKFFYLGHIWDIGETAIWSELVALESTIKNYYTGNISYSDEDLNEFKKYIIENKLEVFEYLKNNKEIIHIILFDMGNFLRKEDIDELLNKFDVEINAMLLEYSNKIRNDNINLLDDLDDDEDEKGNPKILKP